MRRAILVVLLAAMSGSASAKWVSAGRTDTLTAYIDPATVRTTGHTVRVWQLYDYKSAQSSSDGKSYLSTRSRYEYDCNEKRTREILIRAHLKNMGAGKVVGTVSSPGEWNPIPPDSILETIWEIACRKR